MKKALKLVISGILVFVAGVLLCSCSGVRIVSVEQVQPKPAVTSAPGNAPAPSAAAVQTPEPTPEPVVFEDLKEGDSGEGVTRLQSRLAELGYRVGTTGKYDDDTVRAVKIAQKISGADYDGKASAAFQESLFSDGAAKCDDFYYLAPTTLMSFEELVGDDGDYDDPKGYPNKDTYRVVVDIYHQVVIVYENDNNGGWKPVRYMLCSTGVDDRTPRGTFGMRSHHVRFSIFRNDGRYGQYWSQIKGRIYFHTILYSKKNASAYIEETYKKLGSKDSHGCIRLTIPDARWIYYHLAPESEVKIRKGSDDDTELNEIRKKLVLAEVPEERVELEKGKVPWTDDWKKEDIPAEVKFVNRSQSEG